MSDLPNVYYKKTDTAEELHKIIQHLQDRVQGLTADIDRLRAENAHLTRIKWKCESLEREQESDNEALEQAKKLRELVGALKAMWEDA